MSDRRSKQLMAGQSIALTLKRTAFVLVLSVCLGLGGGCVEQPVPPSFGPALDVPEVRAYRVEATGTVRIGDRGVPGAIQADYIVFPDGKVRMPRFITRMEDVDLEITFAGWPVDSESLRCTTIQNIGAIRGFVENEATLRFPAESAEVVAVSYQKRDSEGRCTGKPRHFKVQNPEVLNIIHNPDLNEFAMAFSFPVEFEGGETRIAVEAEGHYLNRPPLAIIGGGPAHWAPESLKKGCPGDEKGEPVVVRPNGPEGLFWRWRSFSRDPDGEPFTGVEEGKFPRTDLTFEQWAHSVGNAQFRHLGSGPMLDPILFEAGLEHRVLLTVIDRTGSRDSSMCHFQVVEAP